MTEQLSEHDQKMIALAEAQGVRIRAGNATTGEGVEFTAGSDTDPQKVGAPVAATADVKTEEQKAPETQKAYDKSQRPEWCPEKFWNAEAGQVNAEALAKSYGELERGRSNPDIAKPGEQPNEQKTETKPDGEQKTEEKKDEQQTPSASLQSAMEKAAADFKAKGEIGEESFKALEAAGISREYATAYANGLKAQAEVVTLKVYNEAGGEQNYQAMATWAKANWTPEQIAAHNASVTSGDLTATLGAIRTMKSAFEQSNGRAPTTRVEQQGGSNTATPVAMYRSAEEVQKDMNDPRYKSGDPKFHAEVDRKLMAAMNAGIDIGF